MTREIRRAIKREEYETYKSAGSALQELVQEPVVKEECKKMIQKMSEEKKVGKDVNTIKDFINLVYRKPKVTQGDSQHLPEQEEASLTKRGYCWGSELLPMPQCSAGRGGMSVVVNKQALAVKATWESSIWLNTPK